MRKPGSGTAASLKKPTKANSMVTNGVLSPNETRYLEARAAQREWEDKQFAAFWLGREGDLYRWQKQKERLPENFYLPPPKH